ncbi:MAG: hypothetical protein ACRDNY_08125 [Gaiellaceae bacterium]
MTILLALVATGCGGGNDPRLAVGFDGERCDYEGPDRVQAGDIDVSFTNDSEAAAGLAFLSIPAGMDVEPGVGEDAPITNPVPTGGVELVGVVELEAGEDAEEVAALAPGTHVLDCVTFGEKGPEHFWRSAIVEVDR